MARQTREHRHKKRIVRTLIFPTVLYGCETWTITKKMEKKMNACEMWIWRKMQRISRTEKKTNESVRMEIGIEEDETLHEVTGMKLAELRDVTAERKHWRRMVKTVARTRRV